MLVWHYTAGHKWPSIERMGVLLRAEGSLDKTERPAVWFSTHKVFEPTALKNVMNPQGIRFTIPLEVMEHYCDGLYRIGVDPVVTQVIDWITFRRVSGISRRTASHLVAKGRALGANPGDWWASFDTVPREKWVAVERRVQGVWTPV